MKKLLGFSASPRRLGNCDIFIKEVFRQLGSGWELKLIRLPEIEIRPCKACYRCLFNEMRCPLGDDFLTILETLVDADAFVVAAPAYLLSANSNLKKFLDRGLQFYAFVDRLWAKPAVGVAIAGIEGMEGSTKLNVQNFIKMVMADIRGTSVIYGALPGEALLSQGNRDVARRLAQAILDPSKRLSPEAPSCPLCGGDTFRFLPDGGVRCMLCSSTGQYAFRNDQLCFDIKRGKHSFILTKEDAMRHADWLRGMREQFLARKKELKAVVKEYIGLGDEIGKK